MSFCVLSLRRKFATKTEITMTIDELRSAAAVVRDATEEGENTATRIGQLFLDTVNTLCNVSTNAIKGYVVISSTSDLPTSPTTDQQMKGYLLDTTLYVWVGTGGDTLDGKYQSAQLRGADGAPGEPGPKGDSGVSLGDVVLVNDLTTGGEGNALSAEMGKVLNEKIENKVVQSTGTSTTAVMSQKAVSDKLSEVGDKVEELDNKLSTVTTGESDSNEDNIIIERDSGEVIVEITPEYSNFQNLMSNGKRVLTTDDANIPEPIYSEEEEIIFSNKDETEKFAVVNKNGVLAKGFFDLNGNSINADNQLAGKTIRIFGGSVAWMLDKYEAGNILREKTSAILIDSAISGAGFCNNISIENGVVVYTDDAQIQREVDIATTDDQPKADIYILWASTNDGNLPTGTWEDYSAIDGFDENKRLTQCGGINYCIKKLQEFAPSSKIVIIGSLKWFKANNEGYYEFSNSLEGGFKQKVDGQRDCASRFSLPFFNLWENSNINEYNYDFYFYHGEGDVVYPTTIHGNDGVHPNNVGYIMIVNKIINFLKNI